MVSGASRIDELTFLDYGCGDGRYYPYLLGKGFKAENIYGVEVSRARIERCKDKGFKNVFFIELKQPLPFKNNTFDFVNFVEVIEHIPGPSIYFYLNEISRVLKKGGHLILATPNYPVKRFEDIWCAFRYNRWPRLRDDPTHVSRYNYKKLEKVLKRYFNSIDFFIYKEGVLFCLLKKIIFAQKILVTCVK